MLGSTTEALKSPAVHIISAPYLSMPFRVQLLFFLVVAFYREIRANNYLLLVWVL